MEFDQQDILVLKQRLDAIEVRSGLMSKSLWKRAWTVFGYGLLIQIFFLLAYLALFACVALLGSAGS